MERAKVKYPIGIQDFESLIKDGYLYVDKTELIFNLVSINKYIFLSRPRRFGKSLLLSTIKAYFEGKKELFTGLAIEQLETDWKKYPVLLLGLSRTDAYDTNSLQAMLDQQFSLWEETYGIVNKSATLSTRFADIIIKAHETAGERVVVLVDEYDNALINTLHDKELHERNRNLLKSVYSNLKDLDAHIKFGMLTGVSRFSHMTIFSGLNNLDDITLSDNYSAICGITESELLNYFHSGIEYMAEKEQTDRAGMVKKLKSFYDGYHFSAECPDIYNPFSLLSAFNSGRLGSYWMRTGTPTFLVKRLMEENVNFKKLFSTEANESLLSDSDSFNESLVSVLFQTGYLTIKSYDREWRLYKLGIPNKEVEEGLFENLMNMISDRDKAENGACIRQLVIAARNGEADNFMTLLQSFLSGIPYPLTGNFKEIYFENNLYVIFKMIGMYVDCEVTTAAGRIDMVVTTDRFVYLFEFKLDKSAKEALDQIEAKDYALPFQTDGRTLFKIGVNFSSEKRNIDDWIIT